MVSGYNRDSQWSKYLVMNAIEELREAPAIFREALAAMTVHADRMAEAAQRDFMVAVDLADLIAGRADLVITRPGGVVPETAIAQLLRNPVVRGASPVSTTYVQPKKEGAEAFLLIGIDPILDRPFRNWQVVRTTDARNQAWLSETVLELLHLPGRLVLCFQSWIQGPNEPGGELLTGDVTEYLVRMIVADVVSYSLYKVSLAQTDTSVDEKRIGGGVAQLIGNGERSCVGKAIVGSFHESLENVAGTEVVREKLVPGRVNLPQG